MQIEWFPASYMKKTFNLNVFWQRSWLQSMIFACSMWKKSCSNLHCQNILKSEVFSYKIRWCSSGRHTSRCSASTGWTIWFESFWTSNRVLALIKYGSGLINRRPIPTNEKGFSLWTNRDFHPNQMSPRIRWCSSSRHTSRCSASPRPRRAGSPPT